MKGIIDNTEQLLVALGCLTLDDQCGSRIIVDVCYLLILAERVNGSQVPCIPLPAGLKGQESVCSCLEMHVVGRTCSTLRTVIEYHQFRILIQQTVNLAIIVLDALRLVFLLRNGKMNREDWIGVDEKMETTVNILRHLLCRTVLVAEEARTFRQGLGIDLRSCGHDPGRIELYQHSLVAYGQVA